VYANLVPGDILLAGGVVVRSDESGVHYRSSVDGREELLPDQEDGFLWFIERDTTLAIKQIVEIVYDAL
jgi:hypothetical protein